MAQNSVRNSYSSILVLVATAELSICLIVKTMKWIEYNEERGWAKEGGDVSKHATAASPM